MSNIRPDAAADTHYGHHRVFLESEGLLLLALLLAPVLGASTNTDETQLDPESAFHGLCIAFFAHLLWRQYFPWKCMVQS